MKGWPSLVDGAALLMRSGETRREFESLTLRQAVVAQRLEHRADNSGAGGSIPPVGTQQGLAPVAQWIEHEITDLGVAGSNPVGGSFETWRSLVAHPAGGRRAAGSNPAVPTQRVLAQLGRAPRSGRGGRGFKSLVPDSWRVVRNRSATGLENRHRVNARGFNSFTFRHAPVAQWTELRTLTP